MRSDIAVFLRKGTKIGASESAEGSVVLHVEGANGYSTDLRLYFDDMDQAQRLADVIYHLRMDCDQVAEKCTTVVTSPG